MSFRSFHFIKALFKSFVIHIKRNGTDASTVISDMCLDIISIDTSHYGSNKTVSVHWICVKPHIFISAAAQEVTLMSIRSVY